MVICRTLAAQWDACRVGVWLGVYFAAPGVCAVCGGVAGVGSVREATKVIDPIHLLKYVIRPTLKELDLWSIEAEQLVLGTACQESACGEYLKQLGGGPALGIYQMEPATHDDLIKNFLQYKPPLRDKVWSYVRKQPPISNEMIGNLYYATAMCRIHYLRVPASIPTGLRPQAAYWKKYYNTELGAGTIDEYMKSWERFVGN